jgi:hypothetical protein
VVSKFVFLNPAGSRIFSSERARAGLLFACTFAKNLSIRAGYNPTAFATQPRGTVSDIYDINLDYDNVAFTHRTRLLTTFLYELPFGTNGAYLGHADSVIDGFIDGWELSGVMLFQGGPFPWLRRALTRLATILRTHRVPMRGEP